MEQLKCGKCGFRWVPRVERPTSCPGCKRRDWDTGRERPELSPEAKAVVGEALGRTRAVLDKISPKQKVAGTRQLADEIKKVVGPPVADDSGDPFGFVAGVEAEPASDREKRKGVKVKAAPALTDEDKTTYSPVED